MRLSYAARQAWLESHMDEATAFCASVLRSNREMARSFELYKKTSNDYIEPNPGHGVLRVNWNLARKYQICLTTSTFLRRRSSMTRSE
jgi:hypothetical protein